MNNLYIPKEILHFVEQNIPFPTYVVGGACRDFIIGRTPKDYDLAVQATEEQMKELGFFPIHPTAPVFTHREMKTVEFACTRMEIQNGSTSEDFSFVTGVTIEEDLRRRDITVNSIAWDIKNQEWIDPFFGIDDCETKTARITDRSTFFQSPERILRVFADMSRFGLKLDPASGDLITMNVSKVKLIPTEQIWKQGFKKLLGGVNWIEALKSANLHGVLDELGIKILHLPTYPVDERIAILEYLNPGIIRRFEALKFMGDQKGWKKSLADIEIVVRAFRRWDEDFVEQAMVPSLHRYEIISTMLKWKEQSPDTNIASLVAVADYVGRGAEFATLWAETFKVSEAGPVITSSDLMEIGVSGQWIGKTLKIAKMLQCAGVLA